MTAVVDWGVTDWVDPDMSGLVYDAAQGALTFAIVDAESTSGVAAWTELDDLLVASGTFTGDAPATGLLDRFFVHVDDYGAVPDSTAAGAGTDSTAAIQTAIDDTAFGGSNAGRIVLIGPGSYKTTGPINMKQGTHLTTPHRLRSVAVSNDDVTFGTRIDFHGGASENCIQAIGTLAASISRVRVDGLKLVDRRSSPTGGWGVYFEKVVNQTEIEHMDINGFPGLTTGGGIRVTAQSGNSSDCVRINDIWLTRSNSTTQNFPGTGIYCDRLDNQCWISDIKCDTGSTGIQTAAVRLGDMLAAAKIENVKHENTGSNPTIIINANCEVSIDGVVARIGNQTTAGPVVRFDGSSGHGCTMHNIRRAVAGVLYECVNSGLNQTLSGTELPGVWQGSGGGFYINKFGFRGDSFTPNANRALTIGQLFVAAAPGGLTTPGGKLVVRGDATNQVTIAAQGVTSQTADLVDVRDAAGNVMFRVGVTKPTITGDTTTDTATVLSDLLAALASLGLLTDSST